MTIFAEGKQAFLDGKSRDDNPYRKGVPGMSAEVDKMALLWNSGFTAGQWGKAFEVMTNALAIRV